MSDKQALARALDWQETVIDRGDGTTEPDGWEADSGFGCHYSIEMYFGSDSFGWQVKFDYDVIGDADDPSVAKAIAQEDFERRAKAILALSPSAPARDYSDVVPAQTVEPERAGGEAALRAQLAAARSALERIAAGKVDDPDEIRSAHGARQFAGQLQLIAGEALSTLAQEPAGQSEAKPTRDQIAQIIKGYVTVRVQGENHAPRENERDGLLSAADAILTLFAAHPTVKVSGDATEMRELPKVASAMMALRGGQAGDIFHKGDCLTDYLDLSDLDEFGPKHKFDDDERPWRIAEAVYRAAIRGYDETINRLQRDPNDKVAVSWSTPLPALPLTPEGRS